MRNPGWELLGARSMVELSTPGNLGRCSQASQVQLVARMFACRHPQEFGQPLRTCYPFASCFNFKAVGEEIDLEPVNEGQHASCTSLPTGRLQHLQSWISLHNDVDESSLVPLKNGCAKHPSALSPVDLPTEELCWPADATRQKQRASQ